MTMKTTRRMAAVEERCSNCEHGKLIKEWTGVYGLKYREYKCYAKSTRGKKCSDLRYSCPIGKPLNMES